MHYRIPKSLMVTAISLFIVLVLHKEASAQKFIIGYGLSLYSDLAITTPSESTYPSGSSAETSYDWSVISLSLEMKYNVLEFNTDLALSVASSPSFGFSTYAAAQYSDGGFGNLRIPLYIQLDYGNLSTFQSMKNFGVGIGVGYQYESYGLIGGEESLSFGTVATRLGLRYFNRNNKSREIALKVGLPKTIDSSYKYEGPTGETIEVDFEKKITTFQLSWILYFNY